MTNSQSINLDWNTINGFKNLINRNNIYDPYMVGRIQKFMVEIFSKEECRQIFSAIMYNNIGSLGATISSLTFIAHECYFDIKVDKMIDDNFVIDIITLLIYEILNSNSYLLGISQDSICTMTQISNMTEDILKGYLRRAMSIYKYIDHSSPMKSTCTIHIIPRYSY